MQNSRSLCLFLVVCAFAPLYPKQSLAASVPYAAFTPTIEQIDARFSLTHKDCVERAGNSSTARTECVTESRRLLERQVEEKYRDVLGKLTGEEARALRVGQQSWRRRHRVECISKYENKNDSNIVELVRTCFFEQNVRRMMWLETF
jgi:hypothetical protein